MTKFAALYEFWGSFGVPQYEENSVPTGDDAPEFPYITYQVATGSVGGEIALTASLWYRSESWIDANAKSEEVSKFIGIGGKMIKIDGGILWLRRGVPFSQSMSDESDPMIKRKYLNLVAEFITQD